MSRRFALLLFALTWLNAASGGEIICATTSDEFRQALAAVAADGTYDEIRLQEGVYYAGGQVFSYTAPSRTLKISGGWYMDHDPCDFQHPRADATILDGQGVTAILSLSDFGDAAGTQLAVSNLTLRNGFTNTNTESAALNLYGALHQDLRVQNVIVLSSHNTVATPNIYTNVVNLIGFGDVYFINNVFADCTATYAKLGIFTQSGTQTVYLHNNTLSLYSGGGGGFDALFDSQGSTAFRLVNNAILGQLRVNSRTGTDLIRVWLYSNLGQWSIADYFHALQVQADFNNNISIDPGFQGALDFRPVAGSPLVNRGLNSPVGGSSSTDLDGNPRVDLGFIDVGAFESTHERIFANGFD